MCCSTMKGTERFEYSIYNQRINIQVVFSFEVRVLRNGEVDIQVNLSDVILEGQVVVPGELYS